MAEFTPEEALFAPMSEQEKQEIIDEIGEFDWQSDCSDNTESEKEPLESEGNTDTQSTGSQNANSQSINPESDDISDDFPAGITAPDVYHW